MKKTLRIGLASIKYQNSIDKCVKKVISTLKKGASKHVDIICFPETYIPGLRGSKYWILPPQNQKLQEKALKEIRSTARKYSIAAIIGMEWMTKIGLQNRAFVVSKSGKILGYQTKNQITPDGESKNYVPDGKRKIFKINGIKFGIVICHEGWRYPETVRWAAVRGAKIVFQPQKTGYDVKGKIYKKWGESFYEKAMICRAEENGIYFASVNFAMRFQNSETSLISPNGKCIDYVPYGREKLLIKDIDISEATRLYAKRYNPKWYPN